MYRKTREDVSMEGSDRAQGDFGVCDKTVHEGKKAQELPFYSVIDLTVASTYLDTEYIKKLIVKKVKHSQKEVRWVSVYKTINKLLSVRLF